MTGGKTALAGIGTIARSQHIPVLAASADFRLAAAVSRHAGVEGVLNFADLDAMLASGEAVKSTSSGREIAAENRGLEARRHLVGRTERQPSAFTTRWSIAPKGALPSRASIRTRFRKHAVDCRPARLLPILRPR